MRRTHQKIENGVCSSYGIALVSESSSMGLTWSYVFLYCSNTDKLDANLEFLSAPIPKDCLS
jgi:hypothetical protein